jgi:hypothetical protein
VNDTVSDNKLSNLQQSVEGWLQVLSVTSINLIAATINHKKYSNE